MSPEEQERAALEMIALDLERPKRIADANELALLAYMIEMALAEARDQLAGRE